MLTGRALLLTSCMVVSLGAVSARGQSTMSADAMSGLWTGYAIPPDGANRVALTVEFRFDGRGGVTGRVTGPELPHPGTIRSGTYDARSGALKFEVVVEGEGGVFQFDARIAGDTASGRVRGPDGQDGSIHLVRGSAAAQPAPARPPARPEDPTAAAVRRSFTEVSGWVTRAADLVPPERYGYRPTATVRTFGQLIGHIADSYDYYCGRAMGRNVQWTDAIEKGSTDKATLIARLKQSLDACASAYSPAPADEARPARRELGPLIDNVGHTSLHYGNIVTYMRMLGLVPPSS